MSFAIAGLFASGETVIEDVECVATSYPNFEETLQRARIGKPIRRSAAVERGTVGTSIRRSREESVP
jgi:UDP-N-acetylglucosamine enolpyruvyl transferase